MLKSKFIVLILLGLLLSNCATIIGGQRYYAHVKLNDFPDAEIRYNGLSQGMGNVKFKVDRKHANNLTIAVREDGCETEIFQFHSRKFRGWALAGTILLWTGWYYLPIPWGVLLDAATGALWKPDITEPYIIKINYDNYQYNLPYTGCSTNYKREDLYNGSQTDYSNTQDDGKSKSDKLREIKELFDEGILTEDEFIKEKNKILSEE